MLPAKTNKPKKPRIVACAVRTCRAPFEKRSMAHVACSPACAIILVQQRDEKKRAEKQKAERQQDRERKQALKTRNEWIADVQRWFNLYIRLRDADQLCICCNKPLAPRRAALVGGSYDCGHYRSVGSAPHLRFDERNAHAQRKLCNQWGAGRAVDYRIGLIKRIGLDAVLELEADQAPRKWTIPDLMEMKSKYQRLCRDLKKIRDSI